MYLLKTGAMIYTNSSKQMRKIEHEHLHFTQKEIHLISSLVCHDSEREQESLILFFSIWNAMTDTSLPFHKECLGEKWWCARAGGRAARTKASCRNWRPNVCSVSTGKNWHESPRPSMGTWVAWKYRSLWAEYCELQVQITDGEGYNMWNMPRM